MKTLAFVAALGFAVAVAGCDQAAEPAADTATPMATDTAMPAATDTAMPAATDTAAAATGEPMTMDPAEGSMSEDDRGNDGGRQPAQ